MVRLVLAFFLFSTPALARTDVCGARLQRGSLIQISFTGVPISTEKKAILERAVREVAVWFTGFRLPRTIDIRIDDGIALLASTSGPDDITIPPGGDLDEFTREVLTVFLHELGHVILLENLPGATAADGSLAGTARRVRFTRADFERLEARLGPAFFEAMMNFEQGPKHLADHDRWERARVAKRRAAEDYDALFKAHLPMAEVFADTVPVMFSGRLSVMSDCLDLYSSGRGAYRDFCERHVYDAPEARKAHNVLYRVRFELGALLEAHARIPKRTLAAKILRALRAGLSTGGADAEGYVQELRREFTATRVVRPLLPNQGKPVRSQ